jgi:hypothetical protein
MGTADKHDPWALLREARRLIHTALSIDALQHWACESNDGEVALDDEMRSLRTNIDAALAARQDFAKDVVGWTKGASEDDYTYAQLDSDTYVDVIQADGQWRWSALREQGCGGYCATEAEAKSAAIAAARGLP